MLLVPDVLALVSAFEPGADQQAARSLALTLDLLRRSPAPFSRTSYQPGHLTASGVVLSPDERRVLLVRHRRLRRWLQPGGHIESEDTELVGAALREVLEETAVVARAAEPPVIVGVDVHDIPAANGEPSHWHHDIAFRFIAESSDLRPVEVDAAAWCGVDELHRYHLDQPLRQSVARALSQDLTPRSA